MSAATLREHTRALGIPLRQDAADALCAYLEALLVENAAVNLTAITDFDAALVLHALDSLAVARVVPESPRLALDLGTGNGFPGVGVMALWPTARVVLCDRTRKKVEAVRRALLAAGLPADVRWFDAAQLRRVEPALAAACDLVTARAVGALEPTARTASAALRRGGRFVAWLAGGAALPERLPGGLRLAGSADYALPAPAERTRRIAAWRRA